jgi:hypothetical protein
LGVQVLTPLDLLSGTYYIRTRVDTAGIVVPEITNDSRYPIGEIRMEILDSLPMFKLRRIAKSERADLRITAFPNPTVDGSEVRFSVPKGGRVRVMLSDYDGRFATTLIDEWMDEGRYAVVIDTLDLRPGVYVVQVHAGPDRGIAKIIVTAD